MVVPPIAAPARDTEYFSLSTVSLTVPPVPVACWKLVARVEMPCWKVSSAVDPPVSTPSICDCADVTDWIAESMWPSWFALSPAT